MRIRWRKRLHGAWAGFVGTSRKPACSIRHPKGAKRWRASARGHYWDAAPSWREAAAWCERQILPPPRRSSPPIIALVVEADGKAGVRALDRLYPALAVPHMEHLAETYETVIYEGRWWQMSYECPTAGISGAFRVMVYAHPAAPPALVERAALREIRRRRMMLDEVVYEHGGRYGASAGLQELAERVFEGVI